MTPRELEVLQLAAQGLSNQQIGVRLFVALDTVKGMTNIGAAKMIGVLFLLSTVSYLTGSGLVDDVLGEPEFLTQLYPDRMKVLAGLFLEAINAAAVVGIAVLLIPILKPFKIYDKKVST